MAHLPFLYSLSAVCVYLLCNSLVSAGEDRLFPENILLGSASSAYQIEGAWDEDGKGESIWDHSIHNGILEIEDGSNADVACDSYHRYKEDIALAADLGLQHYRFSISWPRILPNGTKPVNPLGIEHYQKVVQEVEKYGIIPIITLYHWDLPQALQELGGWQDPNIVQYFKDYADIVFESLDSVKYWITFNEPKQFCEDGYENGRFAPGLSIHGHGTYVCAYHVVKAHAAAYHLYKRKFGYLGGKVGIAIDGPWAEPLSDTDEDRKAADRFIQFKCGLYVQPIYKGNWPDIVIERVNNRSLAENRVEPRLPLFTAEEIKEINGTHDFFGLNYYFTYKIYNEEEDLNFATPSIHKDRRAQLYNNTFYNVPEGLRKMLKWTKDNYGDLDIFIFENGMGDNGTIEDNSRVEFIQEYIDALLDSIYIDNVSVIGYTVWSLIDNFEWTRGYGPHYGLIAVDFSDGNLTRTPKKSAGYYKQLIAERKVPHIYNSSKASMRAEIPSLVFLIILICIS